tara:strand:+ start:336 stop:857 length:522 start_codon:yes stop_codon:yes gene_type:complete
MVDAELIKRASSGMSKLCYLAIVVMPLFFAWIWIDFERVALNLGENNALVMPESLDLLSRIMGFTLSVIPVALLIRGLFSLIKFLDNLQESDYFNHQNSIYLGIFASMLLWSTLVRPITDALVTIAVTFNNPPGQRSVSLNLGIDEITGMFFGVLILILSRLISSIQRTRASV